MCLGTLINYWGRLFWCSDVCLGILTTQRSGLFRGYVGGLACWSDCRRAGFRPIRIGITVGGDGEVGLTNMGRGSDL